MVDDALYAHALGGSIPPGPLARSPQGERMEWETLEHHVGWVTELAKTFAMDFDAERFGELLGVYHDFGKIQPQFREYLIGSYRAEATGGRRPSTVPHSAWGAALLYRTLARQSGTYAWADLAMPVLAHHGALGDAPLVDGDLLSFARQHRDQIDQHLESFSQVVAELPPLRKARLTGTDREMRIRMLFSCLVDADRLASQKWSNPSEYALRRAWPRISQLSEHFEAQPIPSQDGSPDVQAVRNEVYGACIAAAELADHGANTPSVYRLTVPTGGGKTRSSLAFALEHARRKDLRRIVVAIPYTSIIDQNVDAYRRFVGDDAVLEHHSAIEFPEERTANRSDRDRQLALDQQRQRMATENWEAPLVVNTTVQLFESLLGSKASKVRKLHNLVKSVVILDEVQALPPTLLKPLLDVLRILSSPVSKGGYGSTVVLCSATQPAFDHPELEAILAERHVVDIVADDRADAHFELLRRVDYTFRPEPVGWDGLADDVSQDRQALVVVNRRKDALAMLAAIRELRGDGEVFHLSSHLCGAHRKAVLHEIRCRLLQDEPVVLVSTQVIEAGVDIDFPIGYRALGPLDRIVQVAGRVNRHGLRATGELIIFVPSDGGAPRGPYQVGVETARRLLNERPTSDLHTTRLHRRYFNDLYREILLDRTHGDSQREIQEDRVDLKFATTADACRLIDEDTVPVVVPYRDGIDRLLEWEAAPSERTWRRLQPYLVNLRRRELTELEYSLEPVTDGLYKWKGTYDDVTHTGPREFMSDPTDLYV